jgi:small-conductance mechanosensitive channel
MDVSDNTVHALVTGAVWLVVFFLLRAVLHRASERWTRRVAVKDPQAAVRQRTALHVLERVLLAIVAAIAIWSVLSIFPATDELGRALLASGAVLAVVAGVALAAPLGNIGAGLLVAFAQPIRLGDRVSVGDATGFVEEINLIYTVLVTDDNRRIFVPNTQLTGNAIVNRTINDPRRTVAASLPLRLGAPIDEARTIVVDELRGLPHADELELRLAIDDVTDKVVWLTVTALAPPGTNVAALSSEVRERALAALGRAELLPSA